MLGLQGNSSSSKVYRCVACSATFNGLASLLVHQATHASALSKVPVLPPKQPSTTPHETVFTNKDLSNHHPSPPTPLPETPAPSFYICDCGEEFQDFNLMLEHKRSHVSTPHLLVSNTVHSSGAGCDQVCPTQHESFKPPVNQPVLALGYPSTSMAQEVHTPTNHKMDVSLKEGVTTASTPQNQCKTPQDRCEEVPENLSTPQEPGAIQDMSPQVKTNSILGSTISQGENLPKNNTLMKMLATAYMKRFHPPQTQSKKTIIPKSEVIPVDVTPATKTEASPNADPSLGQLRRLLIKPGTKTKAPTVSRILDSSKKSIVSLTKTFSPVVLLETRQKLIDPSSNGEHGRYQCGRCRKIYQDLDKLTEHHFLHRKERIKCCRHCKQLIIGKLPFPDNHVCPQLGGKTAQQPCSLRSKLPFVKKIGPFHSVNNTKRVFFCPLCKHSYSRRYNLKMHKCQGPGSSLFEHATPSSQKTQVLRSNSKANTDAEITDKSHISKSVAVGTEATGQIKVEVTSANSGQSAFSELAWSGSAKSFLPFYPKASMLEQCKDASPCRTSLQQGEDSSWDRVATCHEESDEGQWTMPLDDEMEVLSSAEDAENGTEVLSVEHAKTAHTSLSFFIRDGVKRYPCNRCQKTYSRPSTLRRHLRLCGFRPHGFGAAPQSGGAGAIPLNSNNMKPMFDCFVCGKTFNRKDNMFAHRKKCQLKRTVAGMDSGALQQSFSGSAPECQNKQDDGGNWGIMSLPSVLPRRVTCECGAGFTSPRLLLEHLQKHAQESYTCPTCGETVNSWADYEVHLQIHMHPHHQLYKGLQPQRSQPLLLRFQQQSPQRQPSQSGHRPPMKQPIAVQLPNPNKKQRIACTRCNNTFSSRCSLRRHISLNRCKGGRVTNPPKTNHCSRCNTGFPNTISLIFHQRSGICKPAIKPVRCPVCVRWFGTLDGLQKHLLTHNQSESYRCDVCQGTYPNLKSLKNHRRRVHRIMAGDTVPKTKQEPLHS
ncbi:zinc finger protein 616 [Centroberyx affinis]|uniref:zinc finger protein 616 n=1 Tax=Centroberyx affinis TaxID=166261 RepID=UPI003A5BDFF4